MKTDDQIRSDVRAHYGAIARSAQACCEPTAETSQAAPVSTMKSRVQRGRAQLRELLEMCCAIDLDARGHVVEVTPRCRCATEAATT